MSSLQLRNLLGIVCLTLVVLLSIIYVRTINVKSLGESEQQVLNGNNKPTDTFGLRRLQDTANSGNGRAGHTRIHLSRHSSHGHFVAGHSDNSSLTKSTGGHSTKSIHSPKAASILQASRQDSSPAGTADSPVPVKGRLDGVILTTGKDLKVFELSLKSAMEYLTDISDYYIVTPNAIQLNQTLGGMFGPRVHFIDERIFPFHASNVSDIMVETVLQKGVYPLENGNSQFERTVYGRVGWFLQQVLKFYAGRVLGLEDYILLDSDLIWFKPTPFIVRSNHSEEEEGKDSNTNTTRSFYYTTSNQYHPAYFASMTRVLGFGLPEDAPVHRSGITHHMVIAKPVMDSLFAHVEQLHGIPMWQVLLNQSAIELTCRAPRGSICGGGSTLSEFEIYFNYARTKFPETVVIRPLMWANGPASGMLFWPNSGKLESDGPKGNWKSHRHYEVPEVMQRQMEADRLQGYDFVGYHGYAKRRYFELVGVDIDAMCTNVTLTTNSTTCSWNGIEVEQNNATTWFQGCACYMANHQSGP